MVAHDIGRAKTLSTENPQPQLGRLDALDLEADQGTAHDAVTEQGLAEAIDWRGRSTGKQRQRFLGGEGASGAVAEKGAEYDDRALGQRRDRGEDLRHRKSAEVAERDSVLELRERLPGQALPYALGRAGASDEDDPLRAWLETKR